MPPRGGFWTWQYNPSQEARVCCGRVNRGLAILGDTLYMGTIDAHLIAIDAKNGKPLWNRKIGKPGAGYSLTHAPLIVKDKVVVGIAGGEYGIRGFIAAYEASTGKEVWRFNTVRRTWRARLRDMGGRLPGRPAVVPSG